MASAPIEADDYQIVDTNEPGNDDAPQLTEVEQLAVEMGWDPAHKPRNGQFRSAQDWIKSTNAQNKNLRREVSDLKSNVERIVAATDRQVKREVEQRAKEIEERFAQAVEDKDTKAAAEAAQEMRDLESEQQQASRPDTSAEEQFARENPWYGTDEEATAYAVAQSQLLAKKGVSDPAEQIKQVVERVKKRFPEHFENEEKTAPTPKTLTLNNPGRTVRERSGKTFADMPAAARDAAERFYEAAKARGTAPDRKKYEENYAKDFFA